MESLLQGYGLIDFVKTSRVGSEAFNAQRCSNTHKRYLALTEYRGGRRRAFTIIPERRGWRSCTLELRKALSIFQVSYGNGLKVQLSCKPLGGFSREGFMKGGDVDLKPNPIEGVLCLFVNQPKALRSDLRVWVWRLLLWPLVPEWA